jgi:hypothetical protein
MTATDSLRKRLDLTIDRFFGELVEFHPWKPDSVGGGYTSAGGAGPGSPDPSRNRLEVIAVEVSATSEIVSAVAGAEQKLVQSGLWLSIQEDYLETLDNWRKGDLVFLRERGLWYEINWLAPSATHRPLVQLIRRKNP